MMTVEQALQTRLANLEQWVQGVQAQVESVLKLSQRVQQLEGWVHGKGDPSIDVDLPRKIQDARAQLEQYIGQVQAQAKQALEDARAQLKQYIEQVQAQAKQDLETYAAQVRTDIETARNQATQAAQQAQDAATKATTALQNLRQSLGIISTRATNAKNSLNDTIWAFQEYGRVIAYRAAHILDAFTGAGHLCCLVDDVARMLNENVRRTKGSDPDFQLPYYAAVTYLSNTRAAFEQLANEIANLVRSMPT